jgi:hypothetical protein
MRLALVQLLQIEAPAFLVPVGARVRFYVVEPAQLFNIPGNEERSRLFEGNPCLDGVSLQQLASTPDKSRLERSRLCVEPGVQKSSIGFASARTDVWGCFDQNSRQLVAGELARYRGTYHASPDYGYVVRLFSH